MNGTRSFDLVSDDRDRADVDRFPRRRFVALGLVLVVLLAGMGIAVYREISQEVATGPNRFFLSTGSSEPGHLAYSYDTFSGLARQKSVFSAGAQIALSYAADVTKGSLSIEVKDPAGNSVWRLNVAEREARQGSETLPAPTSGEYQFIVTGLDAGGRFDLSWQSS